MLMLHPYPPTTTTKLGLPRIIREYFINGSREIYFSATISIFSETRTSGFIVCYALWLVGADQNLARFPAHERTPWNKLQLMI